MISRRSFRISATIELSADNDDEQEGERALGAERQLSSLPPAKPGPIWSSGQISIGGDHLARSSLCRSPSSALERLLFESLFWPKDELALDDDVGTREGGRDNCCCFRHFCNCFTATVLSHRWPCACVSIAYQVAKERNRMATMTTRSHWTQQVANTYERRPTGCSH